MKIAILSRDRKLYSTNALYEAGIKRGHEMRVIDYVRCHMEITSMRPAIYLGSERLDGFDASSRGSARARPFSAAPWCANSR